jgi:prepilin-type N-terminal cleavage/methylation domain-containing protein
MKKNNYGFTLIESLVAISVLMLVISGTSRAVQQGIYSYTFSKNQITAFYLAQEAIEVIRNRRDQNALANTPSWLTGISVNSADPCWFADTCRVDAIANTIVKCPSSGCPVLRQNLSNGFYGYTSSWTASPFTRTVRLESVGVDEVTLIVTITWTQKLGLPDKVFIARENLLNWQ